MFDDLLSAGSDYPWAGLVSVTQFWGYDSVSPTGLCLRVYQILGINQRSIPGLLKAPDLLSQLSTAQAHPRASTSCASAAAAAGPAGGHDGGQSYVQHQALMELVHRYASLLAAGLPPHRQSSGACVEGVCGRDGEGGGSQQPSAPAVPPVTSPLGDDGSQQPSCAPALCSPAMPSSTSNLSGRHLDDLPTSPSPSGGQPINGLVAPPSDPAGGGGAPPLQSAAAGEAAVAGGEATTAAGEAAVAGGGSTTAAGEAAVAGGEAVAAGGEGSLRHAGPASSSSRPAGGCSSSSSSSWPVSHKAVLAMYELIGACLLQPGSTGGSQLQPQPGCGATAAVGSDPAAPGSSVQAAPGSSVPCSDAVQVQFYDARCRVALKRVACWLHVPWAKMQASGQASG